MRITCVGGGPAGLYFSILMKAYDPGHDVTVLERNPAGATYGWGVTYWGDLLGRLHDQDPPTARAIRAASVRWADGVAYVRGERVVHRGDEGFGIGRHRLLEILADRAAGLGVDVRYGHEVNSPSEVSGADLVVAADGVNSRLRRAVPGHFGTAVATGRNRYLWLGTTKVFDAFTFGFVETGHGWIWCYGYGFSGDRGTCVVECPPETWAGLGLGDLGERDTLDLLGRLFAEPLDGHPLIGDPLVGQRPVGRESGGATSWPAFRTLTNRRWYHGNTVLLGDSAHTTHYSVGAGTRLALEDAIGLAGALRRHRDIAPALEAYQRERQFALLPAQSAARYSARWYEDLARYLSLEPAQMFALLGQRHSPLLPHVPPLLYYRIHRVTEEFAVLRNLRRRLGPRLARTLHARRTEAAGG